MKSPIRATRGAKRSMIEREKELILLKHSAYALLIAILPAIPWQCAAAQESFAIDPVHTRVAFRVMHAGFSPSIGTVSQPTGIIWFDDKNMENSHVEIEIPVNRVDMGDQEWTDKVTSSLLKIDKYPTASFKSTAVRAVSENMLLVDGQLSVAGESAPITFTTLINANKRHPLTFKKTLGMQAFGNISRKSLGIDAWPGVIGDNVHFDLSIEATLMHKEQVSKDNDQK